VAEVTLDSKTQAVLAYKVLGLPEPIDSATHLTAIYESDKVTSASAGIGFAFLFRLLFETASDHRGHGFYNSDLLSDESTFVATNFGRNKSSLVEGSNLISSIEKVFPVSKSLTSLFCEVDILLYEK
jgi:hypothetical protein